MHPLIQEEAAWQDSRIRGKVTVQAILDRLADRLFRSFWLDTSFDEVVGEQFRDFREYLFLQSDKLVISVKLDDLHILFKLDRVFL